ncbi:MAG: hypothetical protein GY862_03020 [Gammaproteobacteria bacterium]|nr:hypothetical protein [Gammaproteobacteria bacterium]
MNTPSMDNKKRAADFGENQQPLNTSLPTENIQQPGRSVKKNTPDQIVFPSEQEFSFTMMSKAEGILTKHIKLIDGEIKKDSSECWINRGRAETVRMEPEEFGPFLQGLQNNQALVHGVSAYDNALIVSRKQLTTKAEEEPQTDEQGLPIISRTKGFFHYSNGPGLLMLDHDKARNNAVALDPEKALKGYTPEELTAIIADFFNTLKGAARVAVCSTSSCIYDADTEEELRGKSAGFHLYLFPQNAQDTPRFLKVLGKRLILAGYGRVEFSQSGAVLVRTLIDLLVASPERLDFVAGAVCDKGLEQRLPAPVYQPGGLLDTEALNDLNPEEEKAYQEIIRELKAKGAPDQERIKAAYLEQEAGKLSSESEGKISMEQARETVTARQHHILVDDDLLLFAHLEEPVSVAYVVDNGPEFDKKSCADPLEPEYDGGSKTKAVFYWNEGQNPLIYSHAHGSIKYRFRRYGAEEPIDYDTALPELIERTKDDCGAPFEEDALKMLARLKQQDKSRFMRTRDKLKAANRAVLLKELDKDINKVPPVRKSFQSSQPSSSSLSIPYSSLPPSLKEKVLHLQGVLVIETIKGDRPAPESEAAALFAETLHGLYAFSMSGLCWYRFDECCWQKCSASEFEGALNALLYPATAGLGFSNNYQNGISQLLQKSGQNPLPDPLPDTIPFQNGLLDQKSRELVPVTAENAHTWVLPYEYSPDADCPNFLAWLETALDNDPESVRLIQAWFNSLFIGRPDLQIFLHLIGPAGTGKSTLGRLAFELVGKANTTTTTLKELEQNRFETANIYGKRLTAIEEADKYGGSVSVLKAMTGQDPLRLERKNKQQEGSFIYEGQTLMMSNERLATTDYTSGIERRRITVEFKRRITPEERAAWDKRGGEKAVLYQEAPGIINWALRLSREEVTDIFKSMPERVRRANLEAAMFNNPVFAWMTESLLPDHDSAVQIGTKKERREYGAVSYEYADERLYPNYLTWCGENGRESVALQRFSSSVIDAAQTQGAHVRKERKSDGVKIFGLRIRREGEKSWLDELESGAVQEAAKDCVKDNKLNVFGMQTMKDFSGTSYREPHSIPTPAEQVEEEF